MPQEELYTDMKAMISKDGNTLAQTLLDIVKIVQDLVMPRDEHLPHRKRLIHIITADGVPTNESASRKLWDHMQRNSGNIDYCQIHVKCASHQANLCVHVAICGAVTKSPLKMSGVCAAASRLFKYLVPSYYGTIPRQSPHMGPTCLLHRT